MRRLALLLPLLACACRRTPAVEPPAPAVHRHASAEPPADTLWHESPDGWTVLRPFADAPYPHASRDSGHTNGGHVFDAAHHYRDATVGIFVPRGYQPADAVDLVVHFHGWNNHVGKVFATYGLREQMATQRQGGGLNAILVVPQGPRDAEDSGDGRLELDPGAFARLVGEVLDYLAASGRVPSARAGRITITAHSGGYRVASKVLQLGGLTDHVHDVLLFDASYGDLGGFADWIAGGGDRRLVSLFTEHLAPANFQLLTLLQARGVPVTAVMEPALSDSLLRRRGGALLVHTPELAHDEVMDRHDYFARFVAAGATTATTGDRRTP